MAGDKYEKLFQEGSDVCGAPYPEFLSFFEAYDKRESRVLDLGCGQGRDALFIARLGHQVVGVDAAPTGVAQMLAQAQQEGLSVKGVVADIVAYEPQGMYAIVVMDRVLHMLRSDKERMAVLAKAAAHLDTGGWMLIADMPKNMVKIKGFFADHPRTWRLNAVKKGILFAELRL